MVLKWAMSNISTSMRAYWVTQFDAVQAQLTQANTALLNALNEFESYTLDTGEARQTTRYKPIDELQRAVNILETRLVWINQKINGGGLVNMVLRRRGGSRRGAY